MFDRGIFTISLDLELIWGTQDLFGKDGFGEMCLIERRTVIDRLLELFAEFDISATWCIVGHLFLDECAEIEGIKHPEIIRPQHSWKNGDWFDLDPSSNIDDAPLFYGRDIVEKIRDFPVYQEIGSHSFSHIIYGDEGCSVEAARTDLAECVSVAEKLGVQMTSFVFPRNEIGHLDQLRAAGFSTYRGVEPNWYELRSVPHSVRRLLRLIDVVNATIPPTVLPVKDSSGLWNIPGSAMFFPMDGVRRHIPMSRRVRRAHRGLETAAGDKRIFHFWFHPTNLVNSIDEMFAGLRKILERAAKLRDDRKLDIMPLNAIVDKTEKVFSKPHG